MNGKDTATILKAVEKALDTHDKGDDDDDDGAAATTATTVAPSTIDMLYYTSVHPQTKTTTATTKLSDTILAQLTSTNDKQPVPLSSIVYVAIGSTLVYDRNQNGGTLIENLASLAPTSRRKESISVTNECDFSLLPAAILENILTFSEDKSVSVCRRVCKRWNHEIGTQSPNLWLHLLERHGWSVPTDNVDTDQAATLYQKHYVVMRELKALASTVPAILSNHNNHPSTKHIPHGDVAYNIFRSNNPHFSDDDSCVEVLEFSSDCILAGYFSECSLRLYQTTISGGERQQQAVQVKRCKELIHCTVDPYKRTKKRASKLTAVGLDEQMICCLLRIESIGDEGCMIITDNVLVVLTREDFLTTSGTCGGNIVSLLDKLQIFDVGEIVLNYIMGMDEFHPKLEPLFDYINEGGEFKDVYVKVSDCIAACGSGRFMVEVSISIPNANNNEGTQMLDRKLILFNVHTESIIWIGDSYPVTTEPPAEDMVAVMDTMRQPTPLDGSKGMSFVAVGSELSPWVIVCTIYPSGNVDTEIVDDSVVTTTSLITAEQERGFQQSVGSRSKILLSPKGVITLDDFRLMGGRLIDNKSYITCFPMETLYQHELETRQCSNFTAPSPIGGPQIHQFLGSYLKIIDIACLRDDYVVAICLERFPQNDAEADQEDEQQQMSYSEHLLSIIFHIPSQEEIGRTIWSKSGSNTSEIPFPRFISNACGANSGDLVAVGIGSVGIAMTGENVREIKTSDCDIQDSTKDKSTKKKKATRLKKGSSKKDAFARGMSLRG